MSVTLLVRVPLQVEHLLPYGRREGGRARWRTKVYAAAVGKRQSCNLAAEHAIQHGRHESQASSPLETPLMFRARVKDTMAPWGWRTRYTIREALQVVPRHRQLATFLACVLRAALYVGHARTPADASSACTSGADGASSGKRCLSLSVYHLPLWRCSRGAWSGRRRRSRCGVGV